MRIAVLGDVHGNLPALEAVLADAKADGAEEYYLLGDLVMKGPFPAECLEILRSLGRAAVKGNTDDWYATQVAAGQIRGTRAEQEIARHFEWARQRLSGEQAAYLLGLPLVHASEIGGVDVAFVHGSPHSYMERIAPETSDAELVEMIKDTEAQVLFCGHTHIPLAREVAGRRIFNVGSVGMPLDSDPRASYALVTLAGGECEVEFRRIEYRWEETARAAVERALPYVDEYRRTLATGAQG